MGVPRIEGVMKHRTTELGCGPLVAIVGGTAGRADTRVGTYAQGRRQGIDGAEVTHGAEVATPGFPLEEHGKQGGQGHQRE